MLKHLISISVLVVVASGACFDNGDKEIGGTCYKFVSQQLSFNDARDWCHYQNPVTASYLAYVPNQFTANFLASYARSAFGQNDGFFWIGLSRTKNYNPWTWDTGFKAAFTNFNGDQLSQNNAAESIVNTKWSTFGEEEKMNFVCSYDPTAPPTFAPQTSPLPTTTPQPITARVSTPSVPTTTDDTNCLIPQWSFTFFFAYSKDMGVENYNTTVNIVLEVIRNQQYQDNVFRDAYLDDDNDEVVRQPKDLDAFALDLQTNLPSSNFSSDKTSNLVQLIENFIPTAQETSEYSGKISNWLENSILLLLPSYLPAENSLDLPAHNYTTLINKNVKVFIIMYVDYLEPSDNFDTYSKLAAATNGHWAFGWEYLNVISRLMEIGYGQDLLFSRNVANANISVSRPIGVLRMPKSKDSSIKVTVTITESATSLYKPNKLSLYFTSGSDVTELDLLADYLSFLYSKTNFHTSTISLSAVTNYNVTLSYSTDGKMANDLFIRFWVDRTYYQYAEYVDLDFYPTDPDDKVGGAMRMTVLNNCWQTEHAKISISDCTGLETKKYDVEQTSGLPIGTEGSFPKFAFVPYFCDTFGAGACVSGVEDKYDVQLTVGDYSITRSFQCLPGTEPVDPNCKKDSNGNYMCTHGALPYKRGPTGKLTDCLNRGHLEFDSVDTEDYVCVCDKGYSGVSCQNSQ